MAERNRNGCLCSRLLHHGSKEDQRPVPVGDFVSILELQLPAYRSWRWVAELAHFLRNLDGSA